MDVEFHWVAVGRSQGHERAPEIAIPDPEEEERIARMKEEEIDSRRRPDPVGEIPSVVSVEKKR